MLYDPLALLTRDIESDRLRRRAERLRRDPELVWRVEAVGRRAWRWRLPAWLGRLRPTRGATAGPISPADGAPIAPAPPSLGNP